MMVAMLVCVFAISASAANKIIKLDAEPTLEQIHANPDAYISRLDEFETGDAYATYREADSESVVVLWNQSTTWYVYPAYYLIRSSSYYVSAGVDKLNETIKAADNTAFAGYTSAGGTWTKGECDYIVRIEVPTYVTTVGESYKLEGSANIKEICFPIHQVVDPETGVEKTVTYVTSFSTTNFANSCTKLEYVRNSQYLPKGVINTNNFFNCQNLKEFIIPETVTYISSACFKQCYSLKSMVLPNGVVSMGKAAFSYCTSLESISLGAGFYKFASVNEDYETFQGSNNLKYIYMPDSAYQCVADNGANNVKSVFPSTQKLIIFFTGSEGNAKTLQQLFVNRGNYNTNFSTADLAAYNENIDYATVQANLTKNLIVYNYNACDAFYNGIHVEVVEDNNPCVVTDCQNCDYVNKYVGGNTESGTHTFTHSYAYANGYTQNGADTMTCANAGCMYCAEKTPYVVELAPIFTDFVYSRREGNEFGLVMVYKINKTALGFFEEKTGASVSFGIVAIAQENVKSDKALVNADGTTDYTSIIAADVSKSAPSTVTLVINGAKEQWDEHKSTPFYILGYAINNGAVEYFQNASNADASKLSTISFEAAPSSSPEAPAPEEGDDQ